MPQAGYGLCAVSGAHQLHHHTIPTAMKAMKAIKAKRRTPEERAKKQIEDMVTKHGIIKQFGQTFDDFSDDMTWKKKKLLSITIDMVRHFIKEIWIDAKIFGEIKAIWRARYKKGGVNQVMTASKAMKATSKAMKATSKATKATSNAMKATPKAMDATSRAMKATPKAMKATSKVMKATHKAMNATSKA